MDVQNIRYKAQGTRHKKDPRKKRQEEKTIEKKPRQDPGKKGKERPKSAAEKT